MRHTTSHRNPSPMLRIARTSKYGKGVFSTAPIRRGETITVLSGEVISLDELVSRVNADTLRIDDPLQIGRRKYIVLDTLSRTFNHSCEANAGVRRVSELFALRDISAGEEITYDYSSTIAPTVWRMKCKCGSHHCRKTIGCVLTIPRDTLAKYRKAGALQDYMLKVLRSLRRNGGVVVLPKYEAEALKRL